MEMDLTGTTPADRLPSAQALERLLRLCVKPSIRFHDPLEPRFDAVQPSPMVGRVQKHDVERPRRGPREFYRIAADELYLRRL
jgi:hypothetical protein